MFMCRIQRARCILHALPRYWLMLLLLGVALPLWAASPVQSRLVTVDWTLAETLLALGVIPQGVAQISGYHDWVRQPVLPDTVQEIGLRTQPNLELLSQMAPEHILISRMYLTLESRLSRIAPVSVIDNYTPDGDNWQQMRAATREMGRLVRRPEAAAVLIRTTEQHLHQLAEQIGSINTPLLIIQFMDANHVRVFGKHSLYHSVIERLGLKNAWTGPTNYWGFSLVSLRELAGVEGRLVVVEPLPVGTQTVLNRSGLWQSLPAVRRGDVIYLPPVWSFGALPSARRFADELTVALTTSPTPSTAPR